MVEKTYIWRVKKIGKSMVLTWCVALILFWAFSMEGMVLRQFIVAMLCNPIVNIHTVLSTQYKHRDITNICMLAVVMVCFFYGSVFVTSSGWQPISMSRLAWECLRSWTRIFFTPDFLQPRCISWLRKLLV